jgi:Na+/H+-translocating membrane pyrophosphatase
MYLIMTLTILVPIVIAAFILRKSLDAASMFSAILVMYAGGIGWFIESMESVRVEKPSVSTSLANTNTPTKTPHDALLCISLSSTQCGN